MYRPKNQSKPKPEGRTLFSWQVDSTEDETRWSSLKWLRPIPDEDARFIDRLCKALHDLPTMQGLLKEKPNVADVPIRTYFSKDTTHGTYSREDGIEINRRAKWNESADDLFNRQFVTLGHELKHADQDESGCVLVNRNKYLLRHVNAQLRYNRMIEADATTGSLVTAYERLLLKGDNGPFEKAYEIDTGPVLAYWNLASKDEDAHWDGRAAQAAYEAYLEEDNVERLEEYDMRVCKAFREAAKKHEPLPAVEPVRLAKLFSRYMAPFGNMPFVAQNGDVVHREKYNPKAFTNVMANVTEKVRNTVNETMGMAYFN